MIAADVVETLRQRRNWLTARITAKQSIGWDVEWDTRERDALTATLTGLARLDWWGSDCDDCGNATPGSSTCDSCRSDSFTRELFIVRAAADGDPS